MELPRAESILFPIRTGIAPNRLGHLLDFIYQAYILSSRSNFTNVRRWIIDGREVLAFTFVDPQGLWYVDIEVTADNPIMVKMTPTITTPPNFLNRLRENLIITVQLFEDKMTKTTLYFVWVPDQSNAPMKTSTQKRRILKQVFTGNMLLFFIIFLAFSYGMFILLTRLFSMPITYFPVTLVVVQFVMILFSHKIVKQAGDWPITERSPYVHILQCSFPPWEFDRILKRYPRKTLLGLKKRLMLLKKPFTSTASTLIPKA